VRFLQWPTEDTQPQGEEASHAWLVPKKELLHRGESQIPGAREPLKEVLAQMPSLPVPMLSGEFQSTKSVQLQPFTKGRGLGTSGSSSVATESSHVKDPAQMNTGPQE
jgi:hypothetical protein